MVKYNTTEYMHGSVKYVFVTRGKSAPFNKEEIKAYIDAEEAATVKRPSVDQQVIDNLDGARTPRRVAEALVQEFLHRGQMADAAPQKSFVVPKERETIFLADLKRGLKFCISKYSATESGIREESKRIFPSLNLTKLWEPKEIKNGPEGQAKRP